MSKPVFIELDRTREIRLGVNAFVKIESDLQKPIGQITDSATDLLSVLFHGLNDKELTKEELGDLIDEAGFTYCGKKISEAVNEALKGNESEKNLKKVV